MSGFCVEGSDGGTNKDFCEVCFVCQLDLTTLDSVALKEAHLNECLNAMESRESFGCSTSTVGVNSDLEEEDLIDFESILSNSDTATTSCLRSQEFTCIICDVDLSRRGITSRCHHLKRCSKQHGIGIRDLLHMLSPNYDRNDNIKFEKAKNNSYTDEMVCDLSHDDDLVATHPASKVSAPVLGKRPADSLAAPHPSKTSVPSATSILMANAKLKWSNSSSTGDNKSTMKGTNGSSAAKKKHKLGFSRNNHTSGVQNQNDRFCPSHKKVIQGPHMKKPIIVDGFNYASSELSDCYFLTHFHSDHYGGLTKHFNCGSIYCSPSTCSLVKLKLNIPSKYLHALSLDKKHTVMCDGVPVEVTLTDANHCPGAVLILFQFPNSGEGGRGNSKTVLHTGDFRFCQEMMENSRVLRQLAGDPMRNSKGLVVYLDTTYCDPVHKFPPQQETIDAVKHCVTEDIDTMSARRIASTCHGITSPGSELSGSVESTLYVFGAYGIGKERVFMSVARMLDKKVYVEKSKWKMMLCFDWTAEEKSRLTTTNPHDTNIWVVSMNQINFKSLDNIRSKKRGCKRVVAFQPTGWSFNSPNASARNQQTKHKDASLIKSRTKDGNTIHSVAYSEHSSYDELVQFVSIFKPQRIIPTVNTSTDKVRSQIEFLRAGVKSLEQNENKGVEIESSEFDEDRRLANSTDDTNAELARTYNEFF